MFLLFPQASLVFIPLLVYSIICYLCLMFAPNRFAQMFVIRAGIYTGILLALHFSLVVLVFSLNSYVYALLPVWILPFICSPLYRWAVSRWTAVKVNTILFILVLLGVLIEAVITRGGIVFLIVVGLTMAAPFWSFLLALRAGVWLYKNYETKLTLSRGLGLTVWIATYVAAWRYDILKMYDLYAALPTKPPPECYIATAAAQGHPRLVGSKLVQRADGKFLQVNVQLQVLKCAELALIVVSPRLHTILRRIYDVVGRSLARRIHNPFIADIAYLLLKPCEWLAGLILKTIIPNIDSISKEIYIR